LPLIVEVKGKLNGVHSVPLELNSTGSNVYSAMIPENWIKEPETVESAVLPSSVTATTRFRLACPAASSDLIQSSGVLSPSLERLGIASSLPDKPENITFSRTLRIVEADNKLMILGSVAGVLATSVLIVALYAPHSGGDVPLAAGLQAAAVMQVRAHEAWHRKGQGHRGCSVEGRGQDGMGPRHRGVRLRRRHGHLHRH
jgi:hypothetical protein